MPCSNNQHRLLRSLYLTADEDFYRRLTTLNLEVNHIIRVADFYSASQGGHGTDIAVSTVAEIKDMAERLKNAIDKDRDTYQQRYLEHFKSGLQAASQGVQHSMLEQLLRQKLVYHAVFRERAKRYTRKLGYLNHRLGQHLETFLLEDPAPTVRRAVEQGFTNEFIRRLVKNTNRDMVYFLQNFLECKIPYTTIPTTFQYWTYSESYHSDIHRDDQTNAYPKNLFLGKSPAQNQGNAFNIAVMSFWNIDFPELYSILAHELAHMLIKDVSGNLNPLILSKYQVTGRFGVLARKLDAILDSWLPREIFLNFRVDVEIMADVLAVAQFGFAYLHAWFIEMLNSNFESRHLKDEFSNIVDPDSLFDADIDVAASLDHFIPRHVDMTVYLRGRAMLSLLKHCDMAVDTLEAQYLAAFELHLNNILMLRYHDQKHPNESQLWKTIGNQIDRAMRKSRIGKAINAFRRKANFRGGLLSVDPDDEYWYLREQNISEAIQDSADFSGVFGEYSHSRSFHPLDVPWRMIWRRSLSLIDEHNYCQQFDKNIEIRRNMIHTVQADYIHKTGNIMYPYIMRDELRSDSSKVTERHVFDLNKKYEFIVPKKKRDRRHESIRVIREQYAGYMKNKTGSFEYSWNMDVLGGRFLVFDLLLGASPRDVNGATVPLKQFGRESVKTAVTFGRYDRFFLLDDERYFNRPPSYTGAFLPSPVYKVRRRIIREMASVGLGLQHCLKLPEATSTPAVIVLISLVDKSVRNHFIRFVFPHIVKSFLSENSHIPHLVGEVYSSEGYEDFVIAFYQSDQVNKLETIIRFIQRLYDKDFVSRTEAIITRMEDIFSTSQQTSDWVEGVNASINVRLRSDSAELGFANIIKSELADIPSISSANVSFKCQPGRLDYVIRIPDLGNQYPLFRDIRQKLDLSEHIVRIHTQLSTQVAVDSFLGLAQDEATTEEG